MKLVGERDAAIRNKHVVILASSVAAWSRSQWVKIRLLIQIFIHVGEQEPTELGLE